MNTSANFIYESAVLMSIDTSKINCTHSEAYNCEIRKFSDQLSNLDQTCTYFISNEEKLYKAVLDSKVSKKDLDTLLYMIPINIKKIKELCNNLINCQSVSQVATLMPKLNKILKISEKLFDILYLYQEIEEAREDIINGNTVSIEELFGTI
jgi:hypothetical protein